MVWRLFIRVVLFPLMLTLTVTLIFLTNHLNVQIGLLIFYHSEWVLYYIHLRLHVLFLRYLQIKLCNFFNSIVSVINFLSNIGEKTILINFYLIYLFFFKCRQFLAPKKCNNILIFIKLIIFWKEKLKIYTILLNDFLGLHIMNWVETYSNVGVVSIWS